MSEGLAIALAIAVGAALGVIFYGGLWLTVRGGVASAMPALWFSSSLMLRMSLAAAGFYLVSRDHWERILPCLLGFVIARLIVTPLTQRGKQKRKQTRVEVRNAA